MGEGPNDALDRQAASDSRVLVDVLGIVPVHEILRRRLAEDQSHGQDEQSTHRPTIAPLSGDHADTEPGEKGGGGLGSRINLSAPVSRTAGIRRCRRGTIAANSLISTMARRPICSGLRRIPPLRLFLSLGFGRLPAVREAYDFPCSPARQPNRFLTFRSERENFTCQDYQLPILL